MNTNVIQAMDTLNEHLVIQNEIKPLVIVTLELLFAQGERSGIASLIKGREEELL